jgi:DDE superfamily endonuclease
MPPLYGVRVTRQLTEQGREVVLTDDALIPTQRRTGAADRPDCCGKNHRHRLHFPAPTDKKGKPIWISAAQAGRTHDATTARQDKTVEHLKAPGPGALADLGFIGVDQPRNSDDLVIATGLQHRPYSQAHARAQAGQPRTWPSDEPPSNTASRT